MKKNFFSKVKAVVRQLKQNHQVNNENIREVGKIEASDLMQLLALMMAADAISNSKQTQDLTKYRPGNSVEAKAETEAESNTEATTKIENLLEILSKPMLPMTAESVGLESGSGSGSRSGKEMTEEEMLEADVNSAFLEIGSVKLESSLGTFDVIPMDEVPFSKMQEFSKIDEGEKLEFIINVMGQCMLDPERWQKTVGLFGVNETVELLKQWSSKSENIKARTKFFGL